MKPGHPILAPSRRKLLSLAAALVALPSMRAQAAGRTLRGGVSYRERVALPPEAILEVRLVDVSLADAPARSLAVTRVKTRHRLPIPYRLHFDEAKIQSGHAYALQARITVNGKLWFVTTTRHAVFTGKPDETDIRVVLVKAADVETHAPAGRWRAESIRTHGLAPGFEAVLEIGADGRVTGSGGCNRISGKLSVEGAYMTFGPMMATKMACAADTMDQESRFLAALADTRLWRVDETRDKLILVDGHGKTVMRLVKL